MALTFETESVEVVGAQVLEAQALSVPGWPLTCPDGRQDLELTQGLVEGQATPASFGPVSRNPPGTGLAGGPGLGAWGYIIGAYSHRDFADGAPINIIAKSATTATAPSTSSTTSRSADPVSQPGSASRMRSVVQ